MPCEHFVRTLALAAALSLPHHAAAATPPSILDAPHVHNPRLDDHTRRDVGLRGGAVRYVDAAAAPGGDGLTWATAYADLQDALADAALDPAVLEIHAAAGEYRPDAGTLNRNAAFSIRSGLALLGGFPVGGGDPATRDPDLHVTIMTGDLLNDDGPDFVNRTDNTLNLVVMVGSQPDTLLDGFTIEGGASNLSGGGLFISAGAPAVRNCMLRDNSATSAGGALIHANAQATFEGCVFESNRSGDGGAAYFTGAPMLTECRFIDNQADGDGGALVLQGDEATFETCAFVSNAADGSGGAIHVAAVGRLTIGGGAFELNRADNGGAMFLDSNTDVATITGADFHSNFADSRGGALYAASISDDLTITECTFESNEAFDDGGAAYASTTGRFDRCEFTGNAAYRGGGVYSAFPSFRISRSRFEANFATYGGGFFSEGELTDCTFVGNIALDGGGVAGVDFLSGVTMDRCRFIRNEALRRGGALADQSGSVTNSIFAGNVAVERGGAVDEFEGEMTHCTIVANTAAQIGGLYTAGTLTVRNSIAWMNQDDSGFGEFSQIGSVTADVGSTCIQNMTTFAVNGNIGDDPMFVDLLGPDALPGTEDDDYRLLSASPAIDAADAASVYLEISRDVTGADRILPFFGPDALPDMGAYEAADCDGSGVNDAVEIELGLLDDCDDNGVPDDCQIMLAPDIRDCDGDGVLDLCQINADPSLDLNGNRRLDGCEDCNGNGVIDLIEIDTGMVDDCNMNGVPDECEVAPAASYDVTTATTSPFHYRAGAAYLLNAPFPATHPIELEVRVTADLSSGSEFVTLQVNGLPRVDLFIDNASDCGSGVRSVFLEAAEYNALVAAGDVEVRLIPSRFVDPDFCSNASASIRVRVDGLADVGGDMIPDICQNDCNGDGLPDDYEIDVVGVEDCDGDGVPDECQIADDPALDCDGNGLIDACELLEDPSRDCNMNGALDVCDILDGASTDLNADGVPDECQDCNGNGTPDVDEIASGQLVDCNGDWYPDDCQAPDYVSDPVGPFDENTPQTFIIDDPPASPTGATLAIMARSDIGSTFEDVDVSINGESVATIFEQSWSGDECADVRIETIDIDADAYAALAAGPIEITLTPNTNVEPACDQSFVAIAFGPALGAPFVPDVDLNGVPDACDIAAGDLADCNGNGFADIGERFLDCDENGVPDECQIAADPLLDCDGDGALDACDGSGDAVITSFRRLVTNDPDVNLFEHTFTGVTGVEESATLTIEARHDLGSPDETLTLDIEGVIHQVLFDTPAEDCSLRTAVIEFTPETYELVVQDGAIDVAVTLSDNVDFFVCGPSGFQSFIELTLEYTIPGDCNGNGRPDACDILAGGLPDIDGDDRPDCCLGGDVDNDRVVTFDDLNLLLDNWGMAVEPGTLGDVRIDGVVDFDDLNFVLDNWGQTCEP